mmetsp:Transcript_18229/g.45588  ORF Transcript_18229/g.45588 Transcript_18229/m.45588 type:complete len:151 (-) Transcript_18229:600-1052(-)
MNFASNQNKLFGFSRGIVPVMDKSCMFSWRPSMPWIGEPEGKIKVYAYGWKNSSIEPWEHPAQNPPMGYFDAGEEYIFTVERYDTMCEYRVLDGKSETLINKETTPQEEGGLDSGVKFALYFGGEVPATAPVQVKYSKELCCGDCSQGRN